MAVTQSSSRMPARTFLSKDGKRASELIDRATTTVDATIYPGWSRLKFFLVVTGGCMGNVFLMSVIFFHALISTYKLSEHGAPGGDFPIWSRPALLILYLGIIPIFLVAGVQRVRNLGMSAWGILWFIVPILNLWIGWRMVACPAGYHRYHNLDSHGKVITWMFPVFVVLLVVLNMVAANVLEAIS